MKVSNWDLKRAPDRLKLQKVHFISAPSDVQLRLDALWNSPIALRNRTRSFANYGIRIEMNLDLLLTYCKKVLLRSSVT